MRLSDLRGRSVAIWGTGREGRAAANAIAGHGPASLVAVDDTANFLSLPWDGHLAEAAPLHTGEEGFVRMLAADVVVRSPGVAQTHPRMVELRRRGVTVTGGTALWMADHAASTVGVTGSKGKSTTSSLISALLTGVGHGNAYGGNIGTPALDLPPAERYVLELSCYQCADLTDSPRVVALTSLFPEHLDWHGGEEEYYRDKLNLIAHGPEHVVYNGYDDRLAARLRDVDAVAAGLPDNFHLAVGPGDVPWFHYRQRPLFPRRRLRLLGRHNERNLCVALAALACLGVDCVAERDRLAEAVAGFEALPHRLSEINDPSGLTFVDDTLSTTPHSAMHAIDAYEGRALTVLVGGTDRGLDYGPLRDHLAGRGTVATVIGIPDSGPRIIDVLKDVPTLRTEVAEDLVEAVRLARRLTPPTGVALLSPAAPSYGRYRNFEHRSEAFRQAIEDTAEG